MGELNWVSSPVGSRTARARVCRPERIRASPSRRSSSLSGPRPSHSKLSASGEGVREEGCVCVTQSLFFSSQSLFPLRSRKVSQSLPKILSKSNHEIHLLTSDHLKGLTFSTFSTFLLAKEMFTNHVLNAFMNGWKCLQPSGPEMFFFRSRFFVFPS